MTPATKDKIMNKDKTTELLPLDNCPFCGYKPDNMRENSAAKDNLFSMHLYHQTEFVCPLAGFAISGIEEAKAWNTRATRPTAVNTELLEALKEMQAAMGTTYKPHYPDYIGIRHRAEQAISNATAQGV